jgi:CheY-like chemotaxis protein
LQKAKQLRKIDAELDDLSGIVTFLPAFLSSATQGVGLRRFAADAPDGAPTPSLGSSDAAAAAAPGTWITGTLLPPSASSRVNTAALGTTSLRPDASIYNAELQPDDPAQPQKATPPARSKVIGLDGQSLDMHVMVVDDMLLLRRQAQSWLAQLGCTSRCAVEHLTIACCLLSPSSACTHAAARLLTDGDEVPRELAAATRPFDAIILDIAMTRTDGAAVCHSLRNDLSVRCPIIAMTAATSMSDVQVRHCTRVV